MASSAFRESVDLLGSIRSILENYPFSVGLLRELLQNTDDAKATKQIFALDCRTYPSENVCDPGIAESQGPALLAFNNALFLPEDWIALQNISRSSKREDTSKIGKFGVGIRSCYHITDFLQILSGPDLVIFDPQRSFCEDGGIRFTLKPNTIDSIRDHLETFNHFLPAGWNGEPFDGTIVRLPLRTRPGDIREKTVSPEEIEQLFRDFIQHEINISMLFLQHLRSIELVIIDQEGNIRQLGSCTIDTADRLSDGFYKKLVHIHSATKTTKEEEWLIANLDWPQNDALALLSDRAGSLSEKVLKKHKLRPNVGIAFPLDSFAQRDIGQLFTFLRLPLPTGFPAHVHAFFALTPSRQNLRYHPDNDVVRGSDDQILDEWNKLLFEEFIPRAWSTFLTILAKEIPAENIFSAWPTPQSLTKYGESVYWEKFPQNVLSIVLKAGLAIWPFLDKSTHHPLQDIFIASPLTDISVLRALSNVGLNICEPVPEYLFDMISTYDQWQYRILTPENTSRILRTNFVEKLSDPDIIQTTDFGIILRFLLSSGTLSNIAGLPIIRTVSGSFVSLVEAGHSADDHILLESDAVQLFESCDNDAVRLQDLPPDVVPLFRKHGPSILNVKTLDAKKVVEYLALHPTRRGLDLGSAEVDAEAIGFLSQFWVWMDTWPSRSQLMPQLESLYLLPCVSGMKQADRGHPILKPIGIDQVLAGSISQLGVPFVAATLGASAQKVLEKYGLLKSVCDIHTLLDCLEHSNVWASSVDNARALLKHFNKHMVKFATSSFSDTQVSTFRRLHIFPVVEYQEDGPALTLHRRRVPVENLAVYGIRSFEIIPILPNTVFVDVTILDRRLLPFLNESRPSPISDMEVLDLCFQRLDRQPKRLLAKMLQHLVSRRNWMTSNQMESLRSERFIHSAAGSLQMPRTLIDPSSLLYPLYAHDHQRLPRQEDGLDQEIVRSLSALKLLDSALSPENIKDRIQHIASNPTNDSAPFSIRLLNILYEQGFPCNTLNLDKSIAWLPTQKMTLVTAQQCRPGQNTSTDELYLFDYVLDLVHSDAKVSPSLPRMLGWADPIPVDTLTKQFRLVLENNGHDVYPRVKRLVKELAKRNLTPRERATLDAELENKAWVPTSEYGRLVEPWQAVFSSPFHGIWQVSLDLVRTGKGRSFLESLGCLAVPSFETAERRLLQLSREPASIDTTTSAIALLKYVIEPSSLDLSEEERSKLLVPDDRHQLHPIGDTVFNDVGPRAALVKRDGFYLAHSYIDDSLARSLGLERLGLTYIHLQTPGEDMGVTPATVVKKTLEQYTERQFLPEFLANAEDARASQLVVIVNDFTAVSDNFLSPSLERLCSGPSVMVYNDKEFSEKDFEGICRTHVGSKAEDPNSIGQFGLGALTMFHITECAAIYSGGQVLFLDPSKTHLPMSERASLLFPLDNLLEWYPGHAKCLEGLEYFDEAARRVNGTIFFLPLRKALHFVGRRPFVPDVYSIESFKSRILQDFKSKAPDSLLFINLSRIEARLRTSANTSHMLWSFTAQRSKTECNGFSETSISIQEQTGSGSLGSIPMEWLTVSASFSAATIPPEYRPDNTSKILRVGLAAPLNEEHEFKSKFFSTLPLAIPVSLPVHVNASFRLSSDRRQIRLDTYDNDDTRFNRWLLNDKLPPLYIELLERIGLRHDNSSWWPGVSLVAQSSLLDEDVESITTAQEDSLATVLMGSFYSRLSDSTRRIFSSMYTEETFKFRDIVLYSSRPPPAVHRALALLRPPTLVKLSARVRARVKQAGADVVDQKFVNQALLKGRGAEVIREPLGESHLVKLLSYLGGSDPNLLQGLPLLYLANGTWTTFETGRPPYYSWAAGANYVRAEFFPPGRFVAPETMTDELLSVLAESPINVAKLDAAAVKDLVQGRLESLRLDPQAMNAWVMSFWKKFRRLPQTGLLKSVETLALVPRTDAQSFISLVQCKENVVLLSNSFNREIGGYLQELGISVVEMDHFPAELQEQLRHSEYAPNDTVFSRFLHCVTPILNSAISTLRSWTPQKQEAFAQWVRSNIRSKLNNLAARELPVWIARQGNTTSLRSASEISLLPTGVPLSVGRFCRSSVTVDANVLNLGNSRVTISQLSDMLQLPDVLENGEDEAIYGALLGHFLFSNKINTIRVPNARRTMVEPADLFEHTPFFVAAFGEGAPQFLLDSFNTFAHRLHSRGLKREDDLNVTVFAQCARALHQDQATNKLDRGRIVFEMYCEALPLRIPSNTARRWHELDHFRFIPRSGRTSRQYGSREIALPVHIRELPTLVSPGEVVRSKFYDIAWTQRVALAEEPVEGERLLLAFPKFGCPSGAEVIAHLKVLRTLPQGAIVRHDLKATYKWLDQNISEIRELCTELRDEAIFLNVDDPTSDEWRWSAANQLALETHDLSSVQGVRQFLKPFRRLLKAAGVLEVVYPDLEPEDEGSSAAREQANLEELRDGFAEMRLTGRFTDVLFAPASGDDDSEVEPVDRPSLRGHRCFLAVCNPFFRDMFTGTFTESQEASSNQPRAITLPYPHFAIKTALDYLYTGKVSWEEQTVDLDNLLETLDLANYLDIRGLFGFVQREIITRRMVDPDTLIAVQGRAQLLSADTLRRWCDNYETTNQHYISVISQPST